MEMMSELSAQKVNTRRRAHVCNGAVNRGSQEGRGGVGGEMLTKADSAHFPPAAPGEDEHAHLT